MGHQHWFRGDVHRAASVAVKAREEMVSFEMLPKHKLTMEYQQ
jgi:hypothetical protein